MALFEILKDTKNRNRAQMIANIRSMYEDALGYQQLAQHDDDKTDILSLEQVMWADDTQNLDTKPQGLSGGKKSPLPTKLLDDDENFDKLLSRLMKDLKHMPDETRSAQSATIQPQHSRKPNEPYLDAQDRPPSAANISDQPLSPQTSNSLQLELSPELRHRLQEVVYAQNEDRIKAWIDGNLEQIVEDALRYAPSGSRDSNRGL